MKRLIPILASLVFALSLNAADYKRIILDPIYEHDRWNTKPKDIVRIFEAYMVSFDGEDDDNGDGTPDNWGIPEWAAYEIRAIEGELAKGPGRPSTWIHDKNLANRKLAPKDATYANAGYDRGHLCQKFIAWRMGTNADWNTHTTLNACPQLHEFNDGIWGDLEELTQKWADEYGKIWVVCGPVFTNRTVKRWIGDGPEIKAAIPDAFFKIVIKQKNAKSPPDVLAFITPHRDLPKGADGRYDHRPYLVAVDDVEKETGLDFLTALPKATETAIEKEKAKDLWPVTE